MSPPVSDFLDRVTDWAAHQPTIVAVALVGSHARGIVGSIYFFKSIPYFDGLEIGYTMFDPQQRRQGIMTEGATHTPSSAYPSCPLYHARHRDRTMGGGGSYHRGCHDRSPWSCFAAPQIWLDEGNRRPVQAYYAP